MDTNVTQILQDLSDLANDLGGTRRQPGGNAPKPTLKSRGLRDSNHESVTISDNVIRNSDVESEGQAGDKEKTTSPKEDWSGIQGLADALEAKVTIGTEEQSERARKWFDKQPISISSSVDRYDPFRYADDFNRLVKSSHPTTSQVASMMICLAPIRHTRPGVRLFGLLDKSMKKAERMSAKEKSSLKRKGVL